MTVLLLAGWLGLTVLGSLLHLLSVLLQVRGASHALPRPRPARDAALAGLAGAGVLALAGVLLWGLDGLVASAGAALALVYALLLGSAAALAARALSRGGLRI